VTRHPALRTIVYAVDQRPAQRVLAAAPSVALRICDLSALPARERQVAADDWGRQIRLIELPLDRAPLLIAPALRMSEREHWLVLFVHHIAFDAWSWVVLFAELPLLYDAFRRGLPEPPLPLPSIDYGDFVLWQRRWFAGEV